MTKKKYFFSILKVDFWWFFNLQKKKCIKLKLQVDNSSSHNDAQNINDLFSFYFRFTYVVVRTTGNNTTTSSSASPIRTDPISHIPTITSSNKLIKGKQSKDDVTKRASVRRTTLGRSKLSRSPVKPLTCTVSSVTSTNHTITTTIANSQSAEQQQQPSLVHERVVLVNEDIIGPVTRSRLCKLGPSLDDSSLETLHKRGKRSLSSSRFYEKKNNRKKQILAPVITGTTLTRKLRKEASLDSALSDVATNANDDNNLSSLLSELPSPIKEAPKSRLKKPSIRSASSSQQKTQQQQNNNNINNNNSSSTTATTTNN